MEHYLGEKLKNLRESRNWSQAELAKRLNKAVSTISGYESDAHAIPLDVLVSISLLYGYPPRYYKLIRLTYFRQSTLFL